LTAYNADIKLDAVKIHAGDQTAVLTGKGLCSVASVEMDGQTFMPAGGSDDATVHLEAKAAVTRRTVTRRRLSLRTGAC
jgi:S-adenosylmethionine:diacylglycerol 3-amino-3-carboxypropyl transferase